MESSFASQTAANLDAYRARESVLYNLRDALEPAAKWDDFLAELEKRGLQIGRAHV